MSEIVDALVSALRRSKKFSLDRFWRVWEVDLLRRCWGDAPSEIARRLGRSVRGVRQKALTLGLRVAADDFSRRRTSLGRIDFFNSWTPEMAYVLGFLFADGSVTDGGHVQLGLAVKDAAHLDAIKGLLALRSRTHVYNQGGAVQIAFRCKPVVRRLASLGLVPRKSTRSVFPQVPAKVMPHFARGVFDGDGSFHERKEIVGYLVAQVLGSRLFLLRLRKVLLEAGVQRASRPYKTRGIWALAVNGRHALKFGEWLYSAGGLCLERKRSVWRRCRETYRPVWHTSPRARRKVCRVR